MSIDLTKALAINGWMSDFELQWLAEQASSHSVIVEIGCYQGRSTRALGDHTKGFVITIDDFKGPRDTIPEFTADENYSKFVSNMNGLMSSGKVQLVKIPYEQMEINPFFKELEPDMLFIDGNHSYEAVKRDINFWKPKMKKGGLLCGHDSSHPPVVQAVSEILGPMSLAVGTSIWFYTV